jgi:hypothetical protein
MIEDDNIEKLFQGAFENFEVTPPASVKIGVDKELENPKRKRRFIFWISMCLILVLSGFVTAMIYSTTSTSTSTSNEHLLVTTANSSGNNLNSGSSLNKAIQRDKVEKSSKEEGQSTNAESIETSESPVDSMVSIKTKKIQSTITKKRFEQNLNAKSQKTTKIIASKGTESESKQSKSVQKTTAKIGKKKTVFEKNRASKLTNEGSVQQSSDHTLSKIIPNSKVERSENNSEKTAPENPEITSKIDLKKSIDSTSEKRVSEASDEKVDSVSTASAVQLDSVKKPENLDKNRDSKNDSDKPKNWMLELYGGPRFGVKPVKSDFALKELNSYQIGLGFSRKLNLGPLKYITLDGEYGGGKEEYHQETKTESIVFVGIDSIPYFDTIFDTIPSGYNYYSIYDTITNSSENNSRSTVTRFAFGLRTQFNFDLGNGFGVAVMPGYYYSMSKFKFSDSANTSVSVSSSQILVGLSVYYDWNRFRFRVGLDSRYELMGKNQNLFFDRRKSFQFTPQFGIGFKF